MNDRGTVLVRRRSMDAPSEKKSGTEITKEESRPTKDLVDRF